MANPYDPPPQPQESAADAYENLPRLTNVDLETPEQVSPFRRIDPPTKVFFDTSKLFLLISGFICFCAIGNGASRHSMISIDLVSRQLREAGLANEWLLALCNTFLITLFHATVATIPFRFVPLESGWFHIFIWPLCLSCFLCAIVF